jgi:hypothetical protein
MAGPAYWTPAAGPCGKVCSDFSWRPLPQHLKLWLLSAVNLFLAVIRSNRGPDDSASLRGLIDSSEGTPPRSRHHYHAQGYWSCCALLFLSRVSGVSLSFTFWDIFVHLVFWDCFAIFHFLRYRVYSKFPAPYCLATRRFSCWFIFAIP